MRELTFDEVYLVSGGKKSSSDKSGNDYGDNDDSCSWGNFAKSTISGAVFGGTGGVLGGPAGVAFGATTGAAAGMAYHIGTCWW